MSGMFRRFGSFVAIVALVATSACGDDDPVRTDASGTDSTQTDAADTSIDPDTSGDTGVDSTGPQAKLTFNIEDASGPKLQDPATAAILALADDKYPGVDDVGFQFDVVIAGTEVPDGTVIDVQLDGKSVGIATMTGGAARLDKITLPCGNNGQQSALAVSATIAGQEVSANKALLLNCGNACNASLVPVEGCISADADPAQAGFQASFTVTTATADCSHAYLKVTDVNGKISESGKVALTNGKAVVTATLSSDETGVVNKTATIVAVVEDQGQPERPKGESAPQIVSITTDKPTITIVSPSKATLTLADDADGNPANGIQHTFVGTVTTLTPSDIGAIVIAVDGVEITKTTLKLNGSFEADLSFPTSKDYELKVSATNSCGLTGELTSTITALATKAKLTIVTPASGGVLNGKDDTNADNGLVMDTSFDVATTDSKDGTTISIFCRKNAAGEVYGTTPVGKAALAGGSATAKIAVSLDSAALGNKIACIARDDGPNPSESPEISLTIGLPLPCVTIQLPTEGFVTSAVSLPVVATATNLEGAVVEAKLTLNGGATFIDTPVGKFKGGSFSSSLPLSVGSPPVPVPDGTYTLSLDAVDAYGNAASAGSCSQLTRVIAIDRTAPVLSLAIPTKVVLDPATDKDTDDSTPGYQTQVVYSVAGESPVSTSTVCITVNGFALPCKTIKGTGQVAFSSVTLQPGANSVVASATDSLGNKSKNVTTAITLQSNAAIVTWTKPAASTIISGDSVAIEVTVTDQKLGVAIDGAAMSVLVNGTEDATVTFLNTGKGVYTATVKNLAAGDSVLQVIALPTGAQIEGVSPPLTVTRKTTKPSISLTSFQDGAVINLATASCVQGLKDCVTNLAVKTTDVGDGATATLVYACDLASAVTVTATVASGVATFNTVTLSHGKVCTLSTSVVDEAGQSAVGSAVKVTVDRVAPAIEKLVPQKNAFFAADDANNTPADGVQVVMSVSLGGVAADAPITITVLDDAGKTFFTSKNTSHPAIAEGKFQTLSLGSVSLPSGKAVKVQIAVADAAGNPTSYTLTVTVVADAPEIRITSPLGSGQASCSTAATCASSEICYLGKCTHPWSKKTTKQLGVSLFGVLAGAKLRVCTDNTSATGAACAGAGTKVVGEATIGESLNGLVDLKNLSDGLHILTAELLPDGKDGAVASNWVSSKATAQVPNRSKLILVDTVAPTLASVLPPKVSTVTDGCLGKASQVKLDGGLPGGSFTFAATLTAEEGVVTILQSGNVVGSAQSVNKVAGTTIKLANEGSVTLTAVATDLVGNEGTSITVGTYTVDTIDPIGEFLAPNKAVLLASDSLDIRLGSTAPDVEGQSTSLKDGGTTVGSAVMTGGEAKYPHSLFGTLTQGKHQLTGTIKDACGNTSTVATTPASIDVDVEAPSVTISTPTQGQAFADSDDASTTQGGYQTSVTFSTSGAATWTVSLASECDANFANCASQTQVASGAAKAGGGEEAPVLVTIPFGSSTNYSVRVSATDASGNVTTVERGFKVSLSGCLVSLKGLPAKGILNTSACAVPNANCASVTLPVTVEFVGPCGSVDTVQLLDNGKVVSTKSPTDSAASFSLVVADAVTTKIEAKVLAGNSASGSSGELPLTSDLTLPVATFAAGKVLGVQTPSSGPTVLRGKAEDRDLAQNGHQVHLILQVTDAALTGGALTSLVDATTGNDLSNGQSIPVKFAANGTVATELKYVTLKENTTTVITGTVTDAAGNQAKAVATVKVDWTAPSAIALSDFQAGDINPRRPFAKLSFKAVADDGSTGVAATSYEVFYSKATITESNVANACKASALTATSLPTPASPSSDETIIVEGPDGRSTSDVCKFAPATDNGATKYYFAVRAVDAAGNAGPLSNVLSTDAIRLRYAKLTSTVAPWTSNFGYLYLSFVGDLNGDGLGDLLLAGSNGAKSCVIYGHASGDLSVPDLDIKTQNAATHTCFDNTLAFGVQATGADVNGDGVDDLIVGVGQGANSGREIHVYLGEKGKAVATTPAFKITNITTAGGSGVRALTTAGNFNGDTSASGKPIHDIAFTMVATASLAADRVFVVPGLANLSTAAPQTLNIESTTDRTKYNVLTITRSDFAGIPAFGIQIKGGANVLLDAGDTQYDDLLIAQNAATQGIYVVRGRSWTGAPTVSISNNLDSGAGDDLKTVLIRPGGTGLNSFLWPTFVDYDGDAIPDIAASHVPSNQQTYLYWIAGKAINTKGAGILALNTSPVPGNSTLFSTGSGYVKSMWVNNVCEAGDFSDAGGGAVSILTARPGWAPGGRSSVSILHPLVRASGSTGKVPSYEEEDLVVTNPFEPATAKMGAAAITGGRDFNGDGAPDLVIAAYPSGYAILIY